MKIKAQFIHGLQAKPNISIELCKDLEVESASNVIPTLWKLKIDRRKTIWFSWTRGQVLKDGDNLDASMNALGMFKARALSDISVSKQLIIQGLEIGKTPLITKIRETFLKVPNNTALMIVATDEVMDQHDKVFYEAMGIDCDRPESISLFQATPENFDIRGDVLQFDAVKV